MCCKSFTYCDRCTIPHTYIHVLVHVCTLYTVQYYIPFNSFLSTMYPATLVIFYPSTLFYLLCILQLWLSSILQLLLLSMCYSLELFFFYISISTDSRSLINVIKNNNIIYWSLCWFLILQHFFNMTNGRWKWNYMTGTCWDLFRVKHVKKTDPTESGKKSLPVQCLTAYSAYSA